MTTQDVLTRVVKVTGRILGLETEQIQPTDNFIFDLGAESLQSVELVAAFEVEFGIDMEQEAALAVQTVEGAAQYISQCLAK